MLRQTQGSLLIVGSIAAGIFLVAFVALMVVGDQNFSPAVFLAGLVAAVAAIVLFRGFHKQPIETRQGGTILSRTPAPGSFTAGDTPGPDAGEVPGSPRDVNVAGTAGVSTGAAPTAVEETTPVESEQRVATDASPSVDGETAFAAPDSPHEPDGIVEGQKPETLDAPRDGGPDDLKRIKGVGPKLEQMLHGMGYYHFSQIASWGPAEVAWVDDNLEGFKGRVSRDNWVAQAEKLDRNEDPDSVETSYSDDD